MLQKQSRKLPIGMTSLIMIGMIAGMIFGVVADQSFEALVVIGQIFLRLIQMSIILLVMGQIIEAVGGIKPAESGKIGLKTVTVFLVSTMLAAAFGLLITTIIQPGGSINLERIDQSTEGISEQNLKIGDTVLSFFPVNVIGSMANGVIVQVILFAILFGLSLSLVIQDNDGEGTNLLSLISSFNKTIMTLVRLVMKLAPIGVFALVASSIGEYGIEMILPLAKYLGTFAFATALFLGIWIVVVCLYARVPLFGLLYGVSRMSTVALATTSSAVTLPTEMEDAETRLGISKEISRIVLPLGVSLNSNGAAMHMAITILTIAQLYGVTYGFNDYLYIVVLATFASLANAVVPGAGLVSLSIVVPQMGLPLESIAIFAGVEWFVGMIRTIANVDTDTFSAILVAKSEGKLDTSVYQLARAETA
ncbi:MAG: dicarboxylate/amino acid:cation symporter [Thermomicrobiales bacterium]|nr:dicarboxylate/amino acid:cation symporter [Thermomicrobiales bacterium]